MRRQPGRSAAWILVAVTALALGRTGVGQTPPQQAQPERPRFRTEANYVRVDVYPTRGGAPVMDLRAEDFEVLEDGVPQTIQAFEHVVVRGGGPAEQRAEPNTVREANQLASDARNRVFVLFLDTPHVSIEGSWSIREPLVRMVDRILGAEDLIGVMTPKMTASDLTLARKTAVLESGLMNIWPWGERNTVMNDERDEMYKRCYPPLTQEMRVGMSVSALASEMIARRQERQTLDAARELVLHLRDLREERKAIITVTEGWLLFRRNPGLTALRKDESLGQEPPPRPAPITVGPTGTLTTSDPRTGSGDLTTCHADRMQLADIDDEQYLREIVGEANRANASFYAVDPRGLAVFDSPLGPQPPPPIAVNMNRLRLRQDSMRTLAEATDGLAAMNSNDLDRSLRRISDDLSSYYLLGYYSTNGKLDGRYRTLKVRVKRPGIDVRARHGYRAATAEEVMAARAATAAPVPDIVSKVAAAIGSLDRVRPGTVFYLHAAPVPGAAGVANLWVAGEFLTATGPWAAGGTASLEVRAGGVASTSQVAIAAGSRAFLTLVTLSPPVAGGVADVRARLVGADAAAERIDQSFRVDLGRGSQALLFRRGPSTGNRLQPVATHQFSRTERLRLEVPAPGQAGAASARLLGKNAQPVEVPITLGERTDDVVGQRWLTADLVLAPLAMGDYAIELTYSSPAGEQRVITPFRLTR